MGAKPFEIPKQLVWKAWTIVRSNQGSGGVDGQSIAGFEQNLKSNLYQIWNRMSSGSYFPPEIRGVEIPKPQGGVRLLGIPTISDRVAQTTVKLHIESRLEQLFLPDSYGYRPNRSTHDAIGVTRKRCWKWKWLLEFDIRAMFDRISHELVMKAVEKHIPEQWCRLYISRWLKAGIQLASGDRLVRTAGTPQGGVISPLLSNLFMHYAFDLWVTRTFADLPWCRYADDGVIHCKTKAQAEYVRSALAVRLESCDLELHSEKTRVVYTGIQTELRQENTTAFSFLGYAFRIRGARSRGSDKIFDSFLPAVSDVALKRMKKTVKQGWKIHLRSDKTLEQIAEFINPAVRGWFNYYSVFYASRMQILAKYIDAQLVRWARRRFRRRYPHRTMLYDWLRDEFRKRPKLFAHWEYFKVY